MELPIYSVEPKLARILFGTAAKLLILWVLFYCGILINAKLLALELRLGIQLIVGLLLLLLFAGQLGLTAAKARAWRYDFYSNRVEFAGSRLHSLLYSNAGQPVLRRGLLDLLAGTGTIVLTKKFKLIGIENYAELQNWLSSFLRAGGR